MVVIFATISKLDMANGEHIPEERGLSIELEWRFSGSWCSELRVRQQFI